MSLIAIDRTPSRIEFAKTIKVHLASERATWISVILVNEPAFRDVELSMSPR
jgi:hypothetical protein